MQANLEMEPWFSCPMALAFEVQSDNLDELEKEIRRAAKSPSNSSLDMLSDRLARISSDLALLNCLVPGKLSEGDWLKFEERQALGEMPSEIRSAGDLKKYQLRYKCCFQKNRESDVFN